MCGRLAVGPDWWSVFFEACFLVGILFPPRKCRRIGRASHLLEFPDNPLKLLNHVTSRAGFNEGVNQASVIPELVRFAHCKARPELISDPSIITKSRTGVVQLVGQSDAQFVGSRGDQVLEILFLPLAPRGLLATPVVGGSICARFHESQNPRAEALADLFSTCLRRMVFQGIVKQCSDGFFFVPAVFQNEGADTEQVGNIRSRSTFSHVACVELDSVVEGFLELKGYLS